MKKKKHLTGSEIKRQYRGFLIVAAMAFLIGIFAPVFVLSSNTPDYDALQEDMMSLTPSNAIIHAEPAFGD